MEDPGVGLSFTYEVHRSVQDLLSTDQENTKDCEAPLETFHTPVVPTKRKRAMGDSNDRSITQTTCNWLQTTCNRWLYVGPTYVVGLAQRWLPTLARRLFAHWVLVGPLEYANRW